ncbi:MAG: hypothetical protein IPO60_07985 [Flavobacteriales bacterium]|nr:hypothetical protein [Flavobacteriales bacterium]
MLVLSDPLTWEQRPGAMTGLEWELLERFAKRQRLHIKAVPVADRDSMLVMLQEGRGDVIAAAYHRWLDGSFTHRTQPYRLVAYARPRTARPGSSDQGSADTLAVSAWSPFWTVCN